MLAGSVLAAPPAVTQLQKVRAITQPSIVYIQTTWSSKIYDSFPPNSDLVGPFKNGLKTGVRTFSVSTRCTGFFVNPDGYIVTAGHCAQYDRGIEALLIDTAADWAARCRCYYNTEDPAKIRAFALQDWRVRGGARDVVVAYASGRPVGRALRARVVDVEKGAYFAGTKEAGDVALLKIDGRDLPALKIARSADLEGTNVWSIGYPAAVDYATDPSFEPTFNPGSISGSRTIQNGLLKVYQFGGDISGGMSGGPTVNAAGEVVGINSFGISGEPLLSYIRPNPIVNELLADHGVKNQIGSVNAVYRAGLSAYFKGDRKTALDNFDQVLEATPSHLLAQEYRRKALLLPKPKNGFPWWLIVVIAGGAVALVAIAFFLRRRALPPEAGEGLASEGGGSVRRSL